MKKLMYTTLANFPMLFENFLANYISCLVIAAILFFGIRFIISLFTLPNKKQLIATAIFTIIATPILFYQLVLLYFYVVNYRPHKAFNKTEWLANSNIRHQMLDDIINNKLILNKDTAQVRQMLGNPNWKLDSVWNTPTQSVWNYEAGSHNSKNRLTSHSLQIMFQYGKVDKVYDTQLR